MPSAVLVELRGLGLARKVAAETGIDTVVAQAPPHDKLDYVMREVGAGRHPLVEWRSTPLHRRPPLRRRRCAPPEPGRAAPSVRRSRYGINRSSSGELKTRCGS
ncbi:hypothetical protein [Burkholderia cenocepacia]|uniref:hypothetical protein n=1 Tax=Burkholderia cenocepacia TaxID=95486 RepID=UPI002AAFCCDF|nr:hypothetical protein [Burkholderia cenocepacia]